MARTVGKPLNSPGQSTGLPWRTIAGAIEEFARLSVALARDTGDTVKE